MKSFSGCWTCRLRKKRCDEIRPTCRNCSTLEITCHFDDDKPSWMDGGAEQKEKAEEVKREVKNAAARRRGVQLVDDQDTMDSQLATYEINQRLSTECPSTAKTMLRGEHSDFWGGLNLDNPLEEQAAEAELDRRFMMLYFEHFFPFLFPFYRPTLLEGGRSWIIELVVGNEVMWHTTLCLSSYFVSVALDGTASGHNVCKTSAWEKLLKQMGITFAMLQSSLQESVSSCAQDLVVRNSRIMGSIIQLQRFEITIGNFENCQKHLNASIALFRHILKATEGVDEIPFYGALSLIGKPLWSITSQQRGAWSSGQAAFRFYTSILIVDDIIASTCSGAAPELFEYHAQLLTNRSSFDQAPPLNLEDFIGCENWVMLQIAEISVLDAWKKSQKKAGQLDMMELVARASMIKQMIKTMLTRLDTKATTPTTTNFSLFTAHNNHLPSIPGGGSCVTIITRIWAHAALLYLSVVVSGWQPGSAGIRDNVLRTLELLEQMPAPELLRTVVWPFCMVGCLAVPDEESRLRGMADALIPHRLFGAARKALEIMENTWRSREELSIDTDFAVCVCSLGYQSLLV